MLHPCDGYFLLRRFGKKILACVGDCCWIVIERCQPFALCGDFCSFGILQILHQRVEVSRIGQCEFVEDVPAIRVNTLADCKIESAQEVELNLTDLIKGKW